MMLLGGQKVYNHSRLELTVTAADGVHQQRYNFTLELHQYIAPIPIPAEWATTVQLVLTLQSDLASLGDLEAARQLLATEVAGAMGLPKRRLHVLRMYAGSTLAEMRILPGLSSSEVSSVQALALLQQQLSNFAGSPLSFGSLTSQIDASADLRVTLGCIDVNGHMSEDDTRCESVPGTTPEAPEEEEENEDKRAGAHGVLSSLPSYLVPLVIVLSLLGVGALAAGYFYRRYTRHHLTAIHRQKDVVECGPDTGRVGISLDTTAQVDATEQEEAQEKSSDHWVLTPSPRTHGWQQHPETADAQESHPSGAPTLIVHTETVAEDSKEEVAQASSPSPARLHTTASTQSASPVQEEANCAASASNSSPSSLDERVHPPPSPLRASTGSAGGRARFVNSALRPHMSILLLLYLLCVFFMPMPGMAMDKDEPMGVPTSNTLASASAAAASASTSASSARPYPMRGNRHPPQRDPATIGESLETVRADQQLREAMTESRQMDEAKKAGMSLEEYKLFKATSKRHLLSLDENQFLPPANAHQLAGAHFIHCSHSDHILWLPTLAAVSKQTLYKHCGN
jgi:hypothetical protein